MAITKLLRIKENKSSTNKSEGLRRCIEYVCNPEKTKDGTLIGGNCGKIPELVYQEMKAHKLLWDKEGGSQGFHIVLSLGPEDTAVADEHLMMQIAEDFARELLQDRYQYLVAVHNDTPTHLHAHIVINSVDQEGRHFHSGKYDWRQRIQPITDRVCERYGLQSLQYDPDRERVSMYHGEWESTRHISLLPPYGVTWNELIRDDIDEVVSMTDDWKNFLEELRNKHYQVRDGKYLSLRPEGKERAIRTGRLGKDYTKEALLERIYSDRKEIAKDYKIYGRPGALYRAIRTRYSKGRGLSPMERRFFIKWVKLSHFRRPDFLHSWRYRVAVIQLERMTKAFEYMIAKDLPNLVSVKEKLQELTAKESELMRERIRIRNHCRDQEDIPMERLQEIRNAIRDIHSEQKLCKTIIDNGMNDQILFERGTVKIDVPQRDFYTRTTIDQALIIDNRDEEGIIVRIPGQKESVLLYKEDSRFMNDGRLLSTYLYHDLNYHIVDNGGKHVRTVSGQMLASYFADRTRRKAR